MKRTLILILLTTAATASLVSQNHYQWVLDTLMVNSPAFRAIAIERDAAQADATAGALLDNPEVEFGYFWPDPQNNEKRWDLKVMQPFEMPQVYVHRARIRHLMSECANADYNRHRIELLTEAQRVCSDMVYYNAYVTLYSHCVKSAEQLSKIFEKKLQAGECTILEYNRVQMDLAATQNKLRMAEAERDMMADDLQMLNGGKPLAFVQDTFSPTPLPENYEEWFAVASEKSPALTALRQKQTLNKEQTALAKSEWWPRFAAGYVSENVVGDTYRGFALQATLPLWRQKGTIKKSRLAETAAQAEYDNEYALQYNHLKGLYRKAVALQQNLRHLQQTFDTFNSESLLLKAFEAGEISLEDYLRQIEFYHDSEISILEIAHELEQTVLQLESYNL